MEPNVLAPVAALTLSLGGVLLLNTRRLWEPISQRYSDIPSQTHDQNELALTLERFRLDLEWTLLNPIGMLSDRPAPMIGALVLAGLVGASLWIAARSGRRLVDRAAPLALAALTFLPLSLLYTEGAHPQMVLLWLVIAASVPLGLWLAGLRLRWLRWGITIGVVGLAMSGLGLQWR